MRSIAPEVIASIRDMTERGKSLREISAVLGIHKATVKRYRKFFVSGGDLGLCECGKARNHAGFCHEQFRLRQLVNPAKCGCGEPAFHRGWCWHRFAGSEKRQAVMAKLHGKPVRVRKPVIVAPRQSTSLPFDGIKPLDKSRLMAGR